MKESQDPLPLSVVSHHAFCPRRAWLEVYGERTDTGQMAQGVADHATVDDPASSRTPRMRAVEVRSERLGIAGRCDSIEIAENGAMTVVEHKAAPVRRRSEVTYAQRIQLATQVLCLREAGHNVTGAAVWFTTTRRRVDVAIDAEMLSKAELHARAARAVVEGRGPPAPLDDDARCTRCSHVGVCLPDEHRRRAMARRIAVTDPVGKILHLTSPGSRTSLRRGQIRASVGDEPPSLVPLAQVSGLVVHGNADVSSALLREMLERGYPVVWCAWSGRVVGWAAPVSGPNGQARRRQHRLDQRIRVHVARAIVATKIRNQAALMRRQGAQERGLMRALARTAEQTTDIDDLFGLEGRAAAVYFRSLAAAIRPSWATMNRRVARPAPDCVNAALNLAYGLLLADVLRSVVACGLDPAGGVLHSAGRNKPALALDLMEEMRSPVADSAVVWAFNNGELRQHDFRYDLDSVRLTPPGRKRLIAAYERRATTEFRHPSFGYRVTWRRAMEVQARMFLAVVMGETDEYQPIAVR